MRLRKESYRVLYKPDTNYFRVVDVVEREAWPIRSREWIGDDNQLA